MFDAKGASKLKVKSFPVPEARATVRLALPKRSPNAFDRHATVVADVQDDVKHTPRSPPPPRSSPAVAVGSPTPKFSPETVSDAYPLCGAFPCTFEVTAASKLKTDSPVPEKDATVSCINRYTSDSGAVLQTNAVPDVHIDVEQLARFPSIAALSVWSLTPKLRPDTVTGAKPDDAIFRCTADATAVSNLSTGDPGSATDATVTLTDVMKSPNAFDRHANVVADVHDDVKHAPRSP